MISRINTWNKVKGLRQKVKTLLHFKPYALHPKPYTLGLKPYTLYLIPLAIITLYLSTLLPSCGIYKFNDVAVPDSIKTIKINYIENRASYINPQLSPRLTEKLRQKFNNQTKMTITNSDNADWVLGCEIREYSLSTSAISGQQAANNRITVSIHITQREDEADKTNEYDISRAFEFSGSKTLQAAESELLEEMIRMLTDEIFNKLFSNW